MASIWSGSLPRSAVLRARDSLQRPRFAPKLFGNSACIHPHFRPPGFLVSSVVEFTMVDAAQGHGELVTDLAAECSRLRKAEVMRIREALIEAGLLDKNARDAA